MYSATAFWTVAACSLLVGTLAGWQVRRAFDPTEQRARELERRLTEADAALAHYRIEVSRHFRGTAERENRLTGDYRELHAQRRDVLVYTRAPLVRDLEVTGPLAVTLWAATDARDIMVSGFFMVGFPGEKREEIGMTFDYAVSSRLHTANFWFATPFEGTELLSQAGEMGLQLAADSESLHVPVHLAGGGYRYGYTIAVNR